MSYHGLVASLARQLASEKHWARLVSPGTKDKRGQNSLGLQSLESFEDSLGDVMVIKNEPQHHMNMMKVITYHIIRNSKIRK